MALAAFWFSIMSLLVKLAADRGLPSQELVLARAVVTLVLSWWAIRRAGIPMWGVNRKLLLVRGMTGSVALMAYYASVAELQLADATIIQYTNPVMTALLAAWSLGERVERLTWIGAAASFVGVLLVARPSFLFGDVAQTIPLSALALATFGSFMSAVAYVMIRHLRDTEHPMVIVWYFPLVAVPAALPFVVMNPVMPVGWEWALLLGIGVATQMGQVNMTRSLITEKAARATGMSYLQIAFAFLWGILLFGERPHWTSLLGAAIILVGTVGISSLAARRTQPVEAGRQSDIAPAAPPT
jgi:drug/metabolite transporter (DMT)-like permease